MTPLILAFALTLFVAVLLSDLAQRSALSPEVLFLASGFLVGPGLLNIGTLTHEHQVLAEYAEIAMFAALFAEGMRIDLADLRARWRAPAIALAIGLPATLALNGVAAHVLTGLPWIQSMLVGAVLSPTDPVLASALVGRREVPGRLRHLLNVESGLNDGLALPAVIALVAMAGHSAAPWLSVGGDTLVGIALGIVVPWAAVHVERLRVFQSAGTYESLNGLAIGLLVFGVARILSANEFLAAFVAGITAGNLDREFSRAFAPLGGAIGEVLKLATLFFFGAVMTPDLFTRAPWQGYAFTAIVLVAVRPLSVGVPLAWEGLARREWIAAVWFGPKGFASAYYALLVASSGIVDATEVFRVSALVVAVSVIAHSSTDVPVARWFVPGQRGPSHLDEQR